MASARRWVSGTVPRRGILGVVIDACTAGVRLSIRADILYANNTLLVAAASGAATEVGKWLIQTQHMPVDAIYSGPVPYPGTSPISALMAFKGSVGHSPRIKPFLKMLVDNGANPDRKDSQR